MKDWWDKGEGSEHMSREIARSAKENPVPHLMCISCDKIEKFKKKNRVLRRENKLLKELILKREGK